MIISGYPEYNITHEGIITKISTGRTIKVRLSKGYKVCNLYNQKGREKTVKVHRLLAICFIPNPENKPCVNHKDGDRSNNNLSNLEWVTYSENTQHAWDTGLAVTSDYCRLRSSETHKGVPKSTTHKDRIRQAHSILVKWTHDIYEDIETSAFELSKVFNKPDFSNLRKVAKGLQLQCKGWRTTGNG